MLEVEVVLGNLVAMVHKVDILIMVVVMVVMV